MFCSTGTLPVFRRKQDSVGQLNLFTLISERLLVHTPYLNIPTYNVLFEILVSSTVACNFRQHSFCLIVSVSTFESICLVKCLE